MTLTPEQLTRLNNGETVRLVEKMEPQPEFVQNGYEPGGYKRGDPSVPCYAWPPTAPFWKPMSQHAKSAPFPPAGTTEVIDGMTVVWGESECKQIWVGDNDHDPEDSGNLWYFTTTIRKGEA